MQATSLALTVRFVERPVRVRSDDRGRLILTGRIRLLLDFRTSSRRQNGRSKNEFQGMIFAGAQTEFEPQLTGTHQRIPDSRF